MGRGLMDARASLHLETRLAAGAAPGQRVEVVSVDGAEVAVKPGDTGTLLEIVGAEVRVLLNSGAEVTFDPHIVRLRRITRPA